MGNLARAGTGETRSDNRRAGEDRGARGAHNAVAGSGTIGGRGPASGPPQTRGPLPTRVEGLPALPDAFQTELEAGLQALGLVLSDAQRAELDGHVRLLVAWNAAINLSGIRDPVAMAREHVVDSLAALAFVPALSLPSSSSPASPAALSLLDLGSGAGFPGLPLAVALPTAGALLVESRVKKARFLAVVTAAIGQADRVRVAPDRAEALAADPARRGRFDIVVARAVASTADLAELSLPLLRVGGSLVAWKRRPLEAELEASVGAVEMLGGGPPAVYPVDLPGLEDHLFVVVPKLAETPSRFPREAAARRRRRL